jgi:hypothetical protein
LLIGIAFLISGHMNAHRERSTRCRTERSAVPLFLSKRGPGSGLWLVTQLLIRSASSVALQAELKTRYDWPVDTCIGDSHETVKTGHICTRLQLCTLRRVAAGQS